MKPELLGLTSAFCYTFFYLLSRVAAQHASPLSVNLWANGICAVLLSLFLPWAAFPDGVSVEALLYFGLAGIASPALAAFFIVLGARRIGISRAGPIGAGLAPLFSSTVAVLALGEVPTWHVLSGTLLIVVGIVTISLERTEIGKTWGHLGFPVLAAVCLALTAVFRKVALREMPAPLFGAAFQSWAGVLFLLLLSPLMAGGEGLRWERRAYPYLVGVGVFVTLSLYPYYAALVEGNVTVVTPLVHTWPLWVVLGARIFLQRLEKVTPQSIGAAVLVVLGSYLLVG